MTTAILPFVSGVLATLAGVASLFFLRFWRRTEDAFFAFFGAAFGTLALCWVVLALTDATAEYRPYVYLLRLVAFGLIIAAIVKKNARAKRTTDSADR
jgi:hypothetical protein